MPKHVTKQRKFAKQETPKSRVHAFRGEDLAESILRWLRRADRRADDVIERLIRLEYDRARELVPGVTGEDRAPRIVDLVRKTLRQWGPLAVLDVDQVGHDWSVSWKPMPSGEASVDELQALRNFLLLKHEGITEIRPCARPGCPEFFLPKFPHQNYHDESCRLTVLAADPERRQGRKEYMRQLRALKKRKKFRSVKNGRK